MPVHVQEMENIHAWGIDPSTQCTGLTVLRPGEQSSFSTTSSPKRSKMPWFLRGAAMVQALVMWLACITPRRYTGHLVVGLEMPGVYAGQGDTAVRLGDIRGLFMGMIFYEYGEWLGAESLHLYPAIRPSSIKKALTGDGRASKQMVLSAVRANYNEDIVSFDEADSIGVALLALEQFRKERSG